MLEKPDYGATRYTLRGPGEGSKPPRCRAHGEMEQSADGFKADSARWREENDA